MNTALLLALAMASGDNAQAIIDTCKRTSSDADRIACLEAAILMRDTSTQVDPPSLQIDAGPADDAVDVEPEPPRTVELREPSPTPQPKEPPQPAVEQPAASGIGAEQVIARQQTQEQKLASLDKAVNQKVSKYEFLTFDRLQVTLENGQVWRQIKGDTRRVNPSLRKNQTVDILETSLGGYKLRLNEMRQEVRVRRIK